MITIIKNSPVPQSRKNSLSEIRNAWNSMAVGDCMVLTEQQTNSLTSLVYKAKGRITQRKQDDGNVHVWKTINTQYPL